MDSFFKELKRRNVFRVVVAYAVISWLLIQVADVLTPALRLPDTLISAITLILILGFIPTILFSWAYEITPDGIKKESEVDRTQSVTAHTAKKLDIITLIAVIGISVLIVWQQMSPPANPSNLTVKHGEMDSVISMPAEDIAQESEKPIVEPVTTENTISDQSIAVLPFANMANDPSNEPFTLGLHDDLLTHLSKISALKVISRTSVMEYKGTTKKIKDIARELGVANILEGGVQKAGNQIRLNVQLIDADTDEHLWAEIYDRELTTENIFNIQTEISKEIAAALKAKLTEAESKSIATIPTNSLEAYNAYLEARQLLEKRTGPALKQAQALFQKAANLDPNYALAYVGEAFALRLLNEYSDLPVSTSIQLSKPLIDKALELQPLLAEAHLANGAMLDEAGQYLEAEKAYKLSLSLNPNIARTYHWYGHMLRVDLGRATEALELHRKAAELDPNSSVIVANVGWSLRSNNFYEQALQIFEKLHANDPEFPGAVNGIAWINDDLGNYAKAIIEQTKAVNLDRGNLLNRFWLYLHYINIDDRNSATRVLEEAKQASPSYASISFQESLLDMLNGNYEKAQNRFIDKVKESNSQNDINALGVFSLLNNQCELALEQWQVIFPEKFMSDYQSNASQIDNDLAIAWCLKETNRVQTQEYLLSSVQTIIASAPTDTQDQLRQVRLFAIQGKSKIAAELYADLIQSKRTRGWYWVDHSPIFSEVRKQAVFFQARQQLMQNLSEQRELLAELTKPQFN